MANIGSQIRPLLPPPHSLLDEQPQFFEVILTPIGCIFTPAPSSIVLLSNVNEEVDEEESRFGTFMG